MSFRAFSGRRSSLTQNLVESCVDWVCGSLWVICVASHCVSSSQHLVVVVSENAGTALVWNSNGRCQRLGYGGSCLESVGFMAT